MQNIVHKIDTLSKRYPKAEWNIEIEKFKNFVTDKHLNAFLDQKSNYPVDHGKKHAEQVLANIISLLDDTIFNKLDIISLFNLLISAIIHDIAMIKMIPHGAYSEKADEIRNRHANKEELEKIIGPVLKTYYNKRWNEILHLASAHAQDIMYNDKRGEAEIITTVEDKIDKQRTVIALNNSQNNEIDKWNLSVRLICIADYLDMGIDRLQDIIDDIDWGEKQEEHIFKHKILDKPEISIANKSINIKLTNESLGRLTNRFDENSLKEALKILTTLQKIHYELKDHIERLNTAASMNIWSIVPLNEKLFGQIFPLSYGIKLHTLVFDKACNANKSEPFEIDMLGHSLYGRLVDKSLGGDKENLNNKIFDRLEHGTNQVRIILLEPDIQLQQSAEVFESQIEMGENKLDRFVLPLYDSNFECKTEKDKGDIQRSLDSIKSDWIHKINNQSMLKVKLTKKIIYSSIMRYGNYMIVTPYSKGLNLQSISLVFSKESPLFDLFLKEFESLWNKKEETRLYLFKKGKKSVEEQEPLAQIIPYNNKEPYRSSFYYEKWLLEEHKERIKYWFEHKDKVIPPYEIEIQPTNICDLKCAHCIGRHIDYIDSDKECLKVADVKLFEKLINWKDKETGFEIERIRISGLKGDPLTKSALPFTKKIIDEYFDKKEIILFTNGKNIQWAITSLLKVKTIHISLDAGTSGTFEEIKRVNAFNEILKNIEHLIEARGANKEPAIGIGYVVTQKNYHEIEEVFKFADKNNLDFLRFKRDLHLPNAISLNAWIKAKNGIEKKYSILYKNIGKIFTTDMPTMHWGGETKSCNSYRFCLTVGPDKNIYTCDHLSTNPETSIAKLEGLELDKMIENIKNRTQFNMLKQCSQCPPFNYRFNYFMPQLNCLYNAYGWDKLNKLIIAYCRN